MKKQHNNMFRIAVFSIAIFLASITSAYATIVTYTLDNMVTETNKTMTGTFEWDYIEGDFENGKGEFTELYIEGYGTDINGLSISIDITKSIEFTLLNFPGHDQGVDITLVFDQLSTTQSTPIDTLNSIFSVGANGDKEKFISGDISPVVVPVPAAFYLFGSGLLGFIGVAKRNKV